MNSYPIISIAIISKGRPEILRQTLENVLQQSQPVTQIVVVVTCPQDIPTGAFPSQIRFVTGPVGITVQRNAAFRHAPPETDYVAFFDDDMELKPNYLEEAAKFIIANPSVVAFSGHMLADGGVTREEARALLSAPPPKEDYAGSFQSSGKHHILYGCNMVIRRPLLDYEPFDENLSLYSFDDYDISMRLKRYGVLGRFKGALGVHLKESSGRINEFRLGYSLIANAWYFIKKGSVHLPMPLALFRFWVVCVGQDILLSLWKYLRRDTSQDWLQRVRGSLLAVRDIFQKKCSPQRIKEL